MDDNYSIPPMIAAPVQPQAPATPPQPGAPETDTSAITREVLAHLSPEELHQWLATSMAGHQMGQLERQREQANAMVSQNHNPHGWFQGLAGGLQNGIAGYQANKALKGQQALLGSQGEARQMMGPKIVDALRKVQALRSLNPAAAQAPASQPQPQPDAQNLGAESSDGWDPAQQLLERLGMGGQ